MLFNLGGGGGGGSGGGGWGAIGGLVGGAIDQGIAAHARGQSWSRQKNVLQNQIFWRVRDLRNAGLNPVLAASSGLGGQSAPSVASATPSTMGSSISSGIQAGTAAGKAGSEIASRKAQADQAHAQERLADEMAANAREDREYIKAKAQREASDAKSAELMVQQRAAEVIQMEALAEILLDPATRKQWQYKQIFGDGAFRMGVGALDQLNEWFGKDARQKLEEYIDSLNLDERPRDEGKWQIEDQRRRKNAKP